MEAVATVRARALSVSPTAIPGARETEPAFGQFLEQTRAFLAS